jgi:hypothetical protein
VADPDERVSAKALALGLPKHAWRTITWRDGSADPLRSRFARVRVRPLDYYCIWTSNLPLQSPHIRIARPAVLAADAASRRSQPVPAEQILRAGGLRKINQLNLSKVHSHKDLF